MAKEFLTSENEHWYWSKKEQVYYPSATTILSKYPKGKYFEKYLADLSSSEEAKERLESAGKRGTNVHEATELLEQGATLNRERYTLEEWQMLIGFVNWYNEYKPEAVAIEQSLVSDTYKTGGTIDRVYRINDILTILDIKTSGSIYDSYWCQTGCYAKMWEEHSGQKVEQTAILRLTTKRKQGYEYAIHVDEDIDRDFETFLAVKKIWDYENDGKQPKEIEIPDQLALDIQE